MRHGFTLVEVALFLAITGALFAGIIIGTQNSIWQQRYNDSVQSFANFLRNIYSEVSNPQSLGEGRSDKAIYGKLISFGQTYGLDGEELTGDEQKIFVYDIVGDAITDGTGSVSDMLSALDANVVIEEKGSNGEIINVVPAGVIESYSPVWNSVIETIPEDGSDLYTGSILIVRHPSSGTINTLVIDDVIQINQKIEEVNNSGIYNDIDTMLTDLLPGEDNSLFGLKEANFCLNPYGRGESGGLKRNIRIIKNARNASGVEIINLDDADNKCGDTAE